MHRHCLLAQFTIESHKDPLGRNTKKQLQKHILSSGKQKKYKKEVQTDSTLIHWGIEEREGETHTTFQDSGSLFLNIDNFKMAGLLEFPNQQPGWLENSHI